MPTVLLLVPKNPKIKKLENYTVKKTSIIGLEEMKQKLNNCHFNNRQNGLHLPRGSRRLKIEHFCRQNAAEISKNVNFQTDKVQGEFQSVKMASKMRKFLEQFFATILVC